MASYAIRFLPAELARRDEPALYLSTDTEWARDCNGVARVTSVSSDVDGYATHAIATRVLRDGDVLRRCMRDRLVADVVHHCAAIADCADWESWSLSGASATSRLTHKERLVMAHQRRHVLRREPGEPSHLGECETCGRTNVSADEPCAGRAA